jgi:6-phosphogluconolactonase
MKTVTAPNGAAVEVFESAEAMAGAFARAMTAAIAERLQEAACFSVALTGGRTPGALYARLGRPEFVAAVDWSRVKVFFGDERTVGPDRPDSNFGMAWGAWLKAGPVPHGQVFRMEGEAAGEAGDWSAADFGELSRVAARYAETLRREVETGENGVPALDVVLLGMGEDGHVASLFPGTRALEETEALAVANVVPQQKTTRLTLTFPVLNAAREVWMLVTGEAKAERAAQVLGWLPGGEACPASRAKPAGGRVRWWMDRASASRIPEE